MSHSVPTASTAATNFVSEPRRLTFTCQIDTALHECLPEPIEDSIDWTL